MVSVRHWLSETMERPLIKLQLTVVVLSVAKDKNYISATVNPALEASAAFWKDLGIMLQPVVRG